MYEIEKPHIQSLTVDGKLEEIAEYIYSLAETLNYIFGTLNARGSSANVKNVVTYAAKDSSAVTYAAKDTGVASDTDSLTKPLTKAEADEVFRKLKPLIIKNAEIIEVFNSKLSARLEGLLTAKSEFGQFAEETRSDLEATSKSLTQMIKSLQTVTTENNTFVENISAYIKSGILDEENGKGIIGIEIGETDGNGSFKVLSRFTGGRLSFYDGDVEQAYFSDRQLYVDSAVFGESIRIGNYIIEKSGGLTFRWAWGE